MLYVNYISIKLQSNQKQNKHNMTKINFLGPFHPYPEISAVFLIHSSFLSDQELFVLIPGILLSLFGEYANMMVFQTWASCHTSLYYQTRITHLFNDFLFPRAPGLSKEKFCAVTKQRQWERIKIPHSIGRVPKQILDLKSQGPQLLKETEHCSQSAGNSLAKGWVYFVTLFALSREY